MGCGCGCGKGKAAQAPGVTAAARRITVYSVIQGATTLSEHTTLVDARAAATAAQGGARVKVSSKIV